VDVDVVARGKKDGMLVGKRFNAAYIISVWDSARQFLSARAESLLSLMKLLLAPKMLLTFVP
jgi:hypothetical protein